MATEIEDNGPFEARVIEALARQLRVDPGVLRADASLADDLKLESLEFMTMIVGLERDFDVNLPDEEAARLRTVGEVVAAMTRHSAPAGSGRLEEASAVRGGG